MDHYKVLGLSKNATKDEIKQAYRKLAMQFHPDKHAHSPQNLKDSATFKFKIISQAYETLIDDRLRADYNIKSSRNQNQSHCSSNYNRKSNYDYGRSNSKRSGFDGHGYGYGYSGAATKGGGRVGGVGLRMEMFFSFLNTRTFHLNAILFGFLLAGYAVIDSGGQSLWEMQNSGKSFEDAMKSIEKAKKFKDET